MMPFDRPVYTSFRELKSSLNVQQLTIRLNLNDLGGDAIIGLEATYPNKKMKTGNFKTIY